VKGRAKLKAPISIRSSESVRQDKLILTTISLCTSSYDLFVAVIVTLFYPFLF